MIHFAGLKAVGESVTNPRRYFDNNLIGTINLYEIMAKYHCKKVCLTSLAYEYLLLLFQLLALTNGKTMPIITRSK